MYTHVLVFRQMDKFDVSITQMFCCKRCENDAIQLLKCVDAAVHKKRRHNIV